MNAQSKEILVRAQGISKKFGTVDALIDVDFTLRRGEIMGLAGHNGAGKSVLIKTMGGIYRPDNGKIFFEEQEAKLSSARDAQARGYFVVPQELNLARQLSVADNIFLGREGYAKKYTGFINQRFIEQKAHQLLLEYFQVDVDPALPVEQLDTVTQRLVQVVRCLAGGAKVIVLDETTAGLAQQERDLLFSNMRLLAEKGIGMVFVSHMISEMLGICDQITALSAGRLTGVDSVQNLDSDKLISMIIGKEFAPEAIEKSLCDSDVLFRVEGLCSKNHKVSDISFDLKKGEILGIYGLRDQGQTLLMETIYGASPKGSGEVLMRNRKLSIQSPSDSIQNGMTYLPERGRKTVFYSKSIAENFAVQLCNFKDKSHRVKLKKERKAAAQAVKKFGVRGFSSLDNKITSLSGGNMQKVLIARTMALNPKVFMLVEPTQGIDIGSKEEVKQLLLEMARQGTGIIIATAEIDDIIGICNRAIIIKDGKLKAVHDAEECNRVKILEESTH